MLFFIFLDLPDVRNPRSDSPVFHLVVVNILGRWLLHCLYWFSNKKIHCTGQEIFFRLLICDTEILAIFAYTSFILYMLNLINNLLSSIFQLKTRQFGILNYDFLFQILANSFDQPIPNNYI